MQPWGAGRYSPSQLLPARPDAGRCDRATSRPSAMDGERSNVGETCPTNRYQTCAIRAEDVTRLPDAADESLKNPSCPRNECPLPDRRDCDADRTISPI